MGSRSGSWFTMSEVKVGGQGQGIGHGVKSGEGSRLGFKSGVKVWRGVKVWGSRLGLRLWSRSGSSSRVKGSRSWLVVTRSGVKVGVKVRVKVRGVVKVRGRGSRSGRLGSDGRWGRLEINSLFLSRTQDRIEFHSIPFHSIPIHSIPCFTQCRFIFILWPKI